MIKKTDPKKVSTWFKIDKQTGRWHIDWDAERGELKYLVIHHSATTKDATSEEIESYNARVYRNRYNLDETGPGGNDPFVKGLGIHSNHVVCQSGAKLGKERQIAYHHLIYSDGKVTTELQPLILRKKALPLIDMVGWHAGNWEINCQSIGICLVGDFTNEQPSDKQLKSLAGLVAYYKQFNPNLEVGPHSKYRKNEPTACPGRTWDAWKKNIGAK